MCVMMRESLGVFRTAIFAGILIAIAGYGFLAGKVVGMFRLSLVWQLWYRIN